jgi:hypothetical protein
MNIIILYSWLHSHYIKGTDKVSMEELIRRGNFVKYGRRRL